jgi:hypothetical protein
MKFIIVFSYLLTYYITFIMFQVHSILKDLIHKSMSETMASNIQIILFFVYMFKPTCYFY